MGADALAGSLAETDGRVWARPSRTSWPSQAAAMNAVNKPTRTTPQTLIVPTCSTRPALPWACHSLAVRGKGLSRQIVTPRRHKHDRAEWICFAFFNAPEPAAFLCRGCLRPTVRIRSRSSASVWASAGDFRLPSGNGHGQSDHSAARFVPQEQGLQRVGRARLTDVARRA